MFFVFFFCFFCECVFNETDCTWSVHGECYVQHEGSGLREGASNDCCASV